MSEQDKKAQDAEEPPPLSCIKTFIYGMPGGALLPFTAMWSLYGNVYYLEFGASLSFIALFTALARSFDLIIDPLMSYVTDASGTGKLSCRIFKRFGRRKPYMCFGSLGMGGMVWMLLNPPYNTETVLSLWFGFFFVTYYIFETLTAIPYNAFGAELSTNSEERTGAFFAEQMFEGLGTLCMIVAPLGFKMIRIPGYSERNDAICLSKDAQEAKVKRAEECLLGRACMDFFEKGWKDAFKPDTALVNIMAGALALQNLGLNFDYSVMAREWDALPDGDRLNSDNWVINGTVLQNTEFVKCYRKCELGCTVASNRTAFMCVGYMFACYIIPTVWLSAWVLKSVWDPAIQGRNPNSDEPDRSPPLVPSIMSTMRNPPFTILLPTWTMDGLVQAVVMAIPYFYVQAVIAPTYMTMEDHGVDCYPSSPDYRNDDCIIPGNEEGKCTGLAALAGNDNTNWRCDVQTVITYGGGAFLFGALMGTPMWAFYSYKFGKFQPWIMFSVTHALFVAGFLFLGTGHVMPLVILTWANGIPFGAKFLNDAFLADIVDYDEYLTGARNEATYFMAKSFIPKVVQIPAQVLPIAFMPLAGYVAPIDGMIQRQPESVGWYIKGVCLIGVIAAALAAILKLKYQLRDTKALEDALHQIRQSKPGIDPITGRSWCPMAIDQREREEQDVFNDCAYFTLATARQILAGEKHIQQTVRLSMVVSLSIAVALVVGVASTIGLLTSDDDTWSFVPTLCMIGCGLMVAVNVFTVTRYMAAQRMLHKVSEHHEPDSPGGVRRAKTQESVGKFVDYVKERSKLGSKSARDSFKGDQPAVDDVAGETAPETPKAEGQAEGKVEPTEKDTDCEPHEETGARDIKMMVTRPHAKTFKS